MGSDDPDENFFQIGAGISAVLRNNVQAFIDYRRVVSLDNVEANLLTVGVRGAF